MSCAITRLNRLRKACSQLGVQIMCVRDTPNIAWLTGFDDVFDEERAHALLVEVADDRADVGNSPTGSRPSSETASRADDEVGEDECRSDAGADGEVDGRAADRSAGRRAVLHTDSRYVTAAERAAANTPIEVSAERVSHAKFALQFIDEVCARDSTNAANSEEAHTSGSEDAHDATGGNANAANSEDAHTAGSEDAHVQFGIENTITLAEYRSLELAVAQSQPNTQPASSRVRLIETDNLVLSLRAVKDADEIARMRAAQAITDAAFSHIVDYMRPGMTEREVQLELEYYMRTHGASGLAFPSIVATGANGASPHAIAGDTRLEAGQCVVLDFGACAQEYCSDITRTVFLGQPDDTMRAAWDVLRRANEQVEDYLRPGVTGKQAHELAEQILDEGGFGGKMGHGLGHGVGMEVHEEPVLSPRNDHVLVEGNVVTVEPGIYIPGEFGMRLEDAGVLTHDGFDVFTQSTHDMIVI